MTKNFQQELAKKKYTWLVTGAAGFIGSHLVESLLKHKQKVIGLDNFSTGHKKNLKQLLSQVPKAQQKNFKFMEADIRSLKDCKKATKGVNYVLHQAALGSVPRSILDPSGSFDSNVQGYVNILFAAKEAKVQKFVYASSSAVYGDHPILPKKEEHIGKPLSPYALTKHVNELTAEIFHRSYGIDCIGLRYFNVFGSRQDPNGPYAAVIPLWIKSLLKNEKIFINGDGETSRDFSYVENNVQANILAALCTDKAALNRVYNISCGDQTTLNELYEILKKNLLPYFPKLKNHQATHREFREGDIRHSLADISAAQKFLGFQPTKKAAEGIALSIEWYKDNL